ncbi:MAG: hypothetical protein P4M02_06835, partial [Clostridia bacterium]|nr:hypothetical protein [Clostridia bacterium]
WATVLIIRNQVLKSRSNPSKFSQHSTKNAGQKQQFAEKAAGVRPTSTKQGARGDYGKSGNSRKYPASMASSRAEKRLEMGAMRSG